MESQFIKIPENSSAAGQSDQASNPLDPDSFAMDPMLETPDNTPEDESAANVLPESGANDSLIIPTPIDSEEEELIDSNLLPETDSNENPPTALEENENQIDLNEEAEPNLDRVTFFKKNTPLEYSHLPKDFLLKMTSTGMPEYKNNVVVFKPLGCPNAPNSIISKRRVFLTKGCNRNQCAKMWFNHCGFEKDNNQHFSEFLIETNGIFSTLEGKYPYYSFIHKKPNDFFTGTVLSNFFQQESVKAQKPTIRIKVLVNTLAYNASILLKRNYLSVPNGPAEAINNSFKATLTPAIISKLNEFAVKLEQEFDNKIKVIPHPLTIEYISIPKNSDNSVSKVRDLIRNPVVRSKFKPGVVTIALGMPVGLPEAVSVNNSLLAGFMTSSLALTGPNLWRHEIAHNIGAGHQPCKYSIDYAEGRSTCTEIFGYKTRLAENVGKYVATDDMSSITDLNNDWESAVNTYAQLFYNGDRQKAQLRVNRIKAAHQAYKDKFYNQNINYWIDYSYALEWHYDIFNTF